MVSVHFHFDYARAVLERITVSLQPHRKRATQAAMRVTMGDPRHQKKKKNPKGAAPEGRRPLEGRLEAALLFCEKYILKAYS